MRGISRAGGRRGARQPWARRRGPGGRWLPGGGSPWPARRAAEGGRAPSGGARNLGHPSSTRRLHGVFPDRCRCPPPPSRPPPPAPHPPSPPPPKNQMVFKNKASKRPMARCREPAPARRSRRCLQRRKRRGRCGETTCPDTPLLTATPKNTPPKHTRTFPEWRVENGEEAGRKKLKNLRKTCGKRQGQKKPQSV